MLPHKSSYRPTLSNMSGSKALIITTSQRTLDTIDSETGATVKTGKATGVYASEMTEPYYVFLDSGMDVDVASIQGGEIPIEALSLQPLVRTEYDSRFLKDEVFKTKVKQSLAVKDVDVNQYDIIFMSGGWGAAYDFAQSDALSQKISEAYAAKKVLGSVCHGALGFVGATKPDGSPLVEGVTMTAVTNKQLKQLLVKGTPKHPETELKKLNANYQSTNSLIDMFSNNVQVDKQNLVVTGQNQKGGVEAAEKAILLLAEHKANK